MDIKDAIAELDKLIAKKGLIPIPINSYTIKSMMMRRQS